MESGAARCEEVRTHQDFAKEQPASSPDSNLARSKSRRSHQDIANPDAWWKIPLKDFLAGTCAGFAGKMIEYPFDTIKVRMQTQHAAGSGAARYASSAQCFRASLADGGIKGLYKGLPLPLFGTMIETSCLFTAMGQVKPLLTGQRNGKEQRELTILETLFAGGVAGAAVSFVLTPIELVKCRMQSAPAGTYSGTMDCIRCALRDGGGPGVLYRGHAATMLREIPGTACWFGAYEMFLRSVSEPGQPHDEIPAWKIVLAGGLGGMAYWSAFYPADTVKSRIQTMSGGGGGGGSFWSVFAGIYRTEGLAGLFSGLGPTLCRAMPANGGVFLVYEMCNRFLTDVFGIEQEQ